MAQQFQIGQRVRLRSSVYMIPQGSIGTVVSLYQPFQNLYGVQFDGDSRTRLIYGVHLSAAMAR